MPKDNIIISTTHIQYTPKAINVELKKEDEVKNKDKLKMKNNHNHKVYSHKNDVGLRNKDKDIVPLLQPLLYMF